MSRSCYRKVPPVGALVKKCPQSELLGKSAASRSLYKKSAASRSSYEKVPPVGDLINKCRQSELL